MIPDVHDRITFWWKALRLGTTQLNTAAGWAGTIILVLGIVGVVVPLVFHLSLWLVAVVLLSLFVILIGEGSYQVWYAADKVRATIVTERDELRTEIEHRFATQRYALEFEGINATTHPSSDPLIGAVELGLNLANHSNEPLRFEVEDIAVATQGKRQSAENTPILNRTGIIPSHSTVIYPAPMVHGLHLPWQMGVLYVTIRFGHPSAPPRYRTSREYRVSASRIVELQPFRASRVNAELIGEPGIEDV
jgi:hypothetical protein